VISHRQRSAALILAGLAAAAACNVADENGYDFEGTKYSAGARNPEWSCSISVYRPNPVFSIFER
jgi:hypothetical protein